MHSTFQLISSVPDLLCSFNFSTCQWRIFLPRVHNPSAFLWSEPLHDDLSLQEGSLYFGRFSKRSNSPSTMCYVFASYLALLCCWLNFSGSRSTELLSSAFLFLAIPTLCVHCVPPPLSFKKGAVMLQLFRLMISQRNKNFCRYQSTGCCYKTRQNAYEKNTSTRYFLFCINNIYYSRLY